MTTQISNVRPLGQTTGVGLLLAPTSLSLKIVDCICSFTAGQTFRNKFPLVHLVLIVTTFAYARVTPFQMDRDLIMNTAFGHQIPSWIPAIVNTLPDTGRIRVQGYACNYMFSEKDIANILRYVNNGGFRNSLVATSSWMNYGCVWRTSVEINMVTSKTTAHLNSFISVIEGKIESIFRYSFKEEGSTMDFHKLPNIMTFPYTKTERDKVFYSYDDVEFEIVPNRDNIFPEINWNDGWVKIVNGVEIINPNMMWLSLQMFGHFSFTLTGDMNWTMRYCARFEQFPREDETLMINSESVLKNVVSRNVAQDAGAENPGQDGGRRDRRAGADYVEQANPFPQGNGLNPGEAVQNPDDQAGRRGNRRRQNNGANGGDNA